MSIELLPLGTLTIVIDQHAVVGATPAGTRIVGEALSCRWVSDRVTAQQHGKMSHDWLMVHNDGSVSVDARLLLMTDDGAPLTITYRGKAAKAALRGRSRLHHSGLRDRRRALLLAQRHPGCGQGRPRGQNPDLRDVSARLRAQNLPYAISCDRRAGR